MNNQITRSLSVNISRPGAATLNLKPTTYLSKISGKFVAAITMIPSVWSKLLQHDKKINENKCYSSNKTPKEIT